MGIELSTQSYGTNYNNYYSDKPDDKSTGRKPFSFMISDNIDTLSSDSVRKDSIVKSEDLSEYIERQLKNSKFDWSDIHKSEMYVSKQKIAPYQHLADESGFIDYKGVIFHCDAEKNQITLGDCSDPNKCMMVTLKGGGTLMVNYDNIEDLTKAITMFSSEDQIRIMRAITVHNMSEQAQKEIDDDKNSIGNSTDENK